MRDWPVSWAGRIDFLFFFFFFSLFVTSNHNVVGWREECRINGCVCKLSFQPPIRDLGGTDGSFDQLRRHSRTDIFSSGLALFSYYYFFFKRKFPSLDFFRASVFLIIHYLCACETDRQLDSKIQQTE